MRPLLVSTGLDERGIGWQGRGDLVSPVWQRPILMGEKCELPRFSGLILYDERGRPIEEHSLKGTPNHDRSLTQNILRCPFNYKNSEPFARLNLRMKFLIFIKRIEIL